jgi:hypothetical protein
MDPGKQHMHCISPSPVLIADDTRSSLFPSSDVEGTVSHPEWSCECARCTLSRGDCWEGNLSDTYGGGNEIFNNIWDCIFNLATRRNKRPTFFRLTSGPAPSRYCCCGVIALKYFLFSRIQPEQRRRNGERNSFMESEQWVLQQYVTPSHFNQARESRGADRITLLTRLATSKESSKSDFFSLGNKSNLYF